MPAIAADIIPVTKITIAPITDEERAGNLDALMPLLDRYATDAARVPRPDLADISEVLLRAHAHATLPAIATRWGRIPSDELDPNLIPALRVFGVACRAVVAALASSDAQESRARLPVALVQQATALKSRVQRYLEYHLADSNVAQRELESIRAGSGHVDLESDLRRYAVLIKNNTALISGDRNFIATDTVDCERTADNIARELASTSSSPTPWVDRLWSAIRHVYADDVRPTAEWLFRKTPSQLDSYPSIFVGFGRPKSVGSDTAPAAPPVAVTPAVTPA